ncbi:MAG TPA: Stk1 family PASTA domain-containing Ser/Thr kinase [Jatrophihabitans sp.]|nr:Stk1 family PASTA domain-containing Ser/Thr kinase [Jatrophihabitans sp.]
MTQPRIVGSRYELGELIGYGGMAEVHRGYDTRLNREVAIKVLRADLARDPSFLNRFRREAHSAAGLNHPSIVSVYDTGEDLAADGTAVPFIVMEFVEGRTLRDILKSEGRLPGRRAMEIVADVCSALDFSHRNGIIHRDIKPANVMITQSGAVKVMDFGIARAVADTSATVTQTANVIGTAQYLSPEQARGEAVDARSDVYSTGCLLYELVTGVPPFQGDSPVAVAYQHVRENPVAPSARNPELPRSVDSIVMKALAKNQLNRYQSAGEMRADLQRALANQPVMAEAVMTDAERTQFIARTPPPPVMPRRGDYAQDDRDERRTGLIWAAVVLALLLVIGAAAFIILDTGSSSGGVKMVTLRSVAGQLPQAAIQSIKQQGLVPKQGADSNGPCPGAPTIRKGEVCITEPKPGTKLSKGSTVFYHLFTPRLVQVPFVEGQSYNQAVQTLHESHLNAKRHKVHSTQPEGKVVRQETQQYTTVKPGTTIVLDVSTGTVRLPDVRGMNIEDARATLDRHQFTDHVERSVTTSNPKKDGIVADESPTPKQAYPVTQKVTLTVYHYVAPPPTCTSVPPTPPPTSPSTGASSSASASASGSPAAESSSSSPGGLPPC